MSLPTMFAWLGAFVSRHWLLTILFWIALVVFVRLVTPEWDSVTYDGDLAYMPSHMPSVQGEMLLERAFPDGRVKSDIVVVVAREDGPINTDDLAVVRRLASRFHNLLGVSAFEKAGQFQQQANEAGAEKADGTDRAGGLLGRAQRQQEIAREAWEEAVRLDEQFAAARHNLGILHDKAGEVEEADRQRAIAWDLDGALRASPRQPAGGYGVLPLIGVWTRYTELLGDKLVARDKRAELIVLRLSQEFMAIDNIPLLEHVEAILGQVRSSTSAPIGLKIATSGSAAVGGDMLRSAKESIDNTELYTVILVVAILILVYRSPLLVAVPLITIVVSLTVATGLVAALTQAHQLPGMSWWNFKVFTTTKIFVVVILFGAGTDFCLFLIARYKEELDAGYEKKTAISRALVGVGDALAASALTTILGLGTMFFAQFGKFRNSGPAIGLCLFVSLVACVTLAPALLRALGGAVYWPFGNRKVTDSAPGEGGENSAESGWLNSIWQRLADVIVARPAWVLVVCVCLMLPFAVLGTDVQITYDLLSELSADRTSKQGARLLRQHFPVGEAGPVVVLAYKPKGDFDSQSGKLALHDLTRCLYIDGVQSVRSIVAPTGKRPKQRMSLFDIPAKSHRLTQEIYLSKEPGLGGQVARFELVLDHDPFSLEATQVLNRVDTLLGELRETADSYWADSRFVFAGTTAAIRDLRQVTRSDNVQIQMLVVLAVLAVLLLILRRPFICFYLILSVLFSYYVTIGATEQYFRWAYGETFEGLDWKVPLFLFVILVAIGQDYNIYLTTRVFEEQRQHGLIGGLRRAIVRTGGIITSCGVIMAGTFVSMTTGTLRGIVELGFALSLGVLLDTFVVRTILVPAFLAILFKREVRKRSAMPVGDTPQPLKKPAWTKKPATFSARQ